MAKRKKLKRVETPTARPRTERVAVSSPTVPGAREEVEHVLDPIEMMYARRQFGQTRGENEFAYRAAQRIRLAYETLYGAGGGSMDFDRVRGQGATPAGPHDGYLQAAEIMRELRTYVYAADHLAIELCVCQGYTIEQAASIIRRRAASRMDRVEVGRCLRQGLLALAERWFGTGGHQGMPRAKTRAWSDPTNEATPAVAGVVQVGGTYVGGR